LIKEGDVTNVILWDYLCKIIVNKIVNSCRGDEKEFSRRPSTSLK